VETQTELATRLVEEALEENPDFATWTQFAQELYLENKVREAIKSPEVVNG